MTLYENVLETGLKVFLDHVPDLENCFEGLVIGLKNLNRYEEAQSIAERGLEAVKKASKGERSVFIGRLKLLYDDILEEGKKLP